MTRDSFKKKVNSVASHLTYPVLDDLHAIDDHDAEQRHIIDEQVEENRGLRADVKLMQQVNDEQREEIRLLREAIDLAMSSRAVVMGRVDAFTILSHFHAKLGSDYCKQRDEARQEIERLRGELSHWTFVRFKELEASNERSMMALQGILDIGKRDMTNPKYDGYFEAARQALTQEPT
jgi:hypothetical protein